MAIKKMRILVFEDDWGRVGWFQEKFQGCKIDVTESVQRATSLLLEHDYDLIFLDHDIHDDMGMKNTGSHLVLNMCRNQELTIKYQYTPIFIHSYSTHGALRMESILEFNGFWHVCRARFNCLKTLFEVKDFQNGRE